MKNRPPPGMGATHPGAGLADDEVEFGRAMEAYRRLRRRPYPTCAEVLGVLKSLGYRKAAPPGPLPGAPR